MHWIHSIGRKCALLAVLLVWTGCATPPPPSNVKAVNCDTAKILWEVAQQAEIENFDCALGKHAGEDSLIFTVTVKNISKDPQRFRLQIFLLDMDKAAGSLIPRKGKPPVLAPGATYTAKVPFMKTPGMARKIQVRVIPMSMD